ncbi:hypothetical protein QT397_09765 [Microbulbifer sp. MKSA007]|uniref:hypothetical protein n=2 Tax=Microbulbifer TaxID=48073 RepID=UPI0024ACB614|nr:hypothetical protein [Microbulbifer sp. VAAF005]WHI46084.1 hypothetical protein P0078_20560 [Microbulbifer sp. VAAF005]WNZ57606.1 hypothetical protein QT397_09765 [Microbulbifer sp. MKSA007]
MEQFRIIQDIREYIKSYDAFFARPTQRGEHPTLYMDDKQGKTYNNIREKDYLFSQCKQWVIPHSQMGLSFSAHWQHLKDQYKLKKKHAKGSPVDVFWVIEKCDLPEGLEFIADERDKQHYFLTVTRKMTTAQLHQKLIWLADRMSVIREAQDAL